MLKDFADDVLYITQILVFHNHKNPGFHNHKNPGFHNHKNPGFHNHKNPGFS